MFTILGSKSTNGTAHTLTSSTNALVPAATSIVSRNGDGIFHESAPGRIDVAGSVTGFDGGIVYSTDDDPEGRFVRAMVADSGRVFGGDRGFRIDFEASMSNLGEIHGNTAGVDFVGDTAILNNHGTITSHLVGAVFVRNAGQIVNGADGVLSGGIGVQFDSVDGAGTLRELSNAGTVVGRKESVFAVGTAPLSIWNGGILQGDVIAAPRTILVSPGTIDGDVELSKAADSVDLRGGTVWGAIELGGGNDRIDLRGATVDKVLGGKGNDLYIVDDASIEIVEPSRKGGNDTIKGTVSFDLGQAPNVEVLQLLGAEDLRGSGNDGDNDLLGNAGDNRLSGGLGEDLLIGLDGEDVLRGGAGRDRAEGGDGDDVLRGGGGNDELVGEEGDDVLRGGVGADDMDGGDGDDLLIGGGGAAADTMVGGAGDDTLVGSPGRDDMTGGDGADSFRFVNAAVIGTASGDRPQIRDFQKEVDVIDLSAIQADPGAVGFDASFIFIGDGPFTGFQPGELRFDTGKVPGRTLIEGDMTGNGSADFTIELTGRLPMEMGDFVL